MPEAKFVIVDIDGTLTILHDRVKYLQKDPPDWDSFYEACEEDYAVDRLIALCNALMYAGYHIVLCTGRRESVRYKTINWLKNNGLHFSSEEHNAQLHGQIKLLMRKDGDFRHDTEIKPEMLKEACIPLNRIHFVIEDRNSMVAKWREMGLICLQAAEGNF